MGLSSWIPVLIIIFYLAIVFGILFLIYKWVSQFIFLKKEHNELLREIIKKIESK